MLPPLYDLDQLFEAIRRGFSRDFWAATPPPNRELTVWVPSRSALKD